MDEIDCRVCGQESELDESDSLVIDHVGADGAICPGSGRPPAGDPPCGPDCHPIGMVAWPLDVPQASTYVCHRPDHQEEGRRWVEEATGHLGEWRPYAAPEWSGQ